MKTDVKVPSRADVNKLASDFANEYSEFLNIDTRREQKQVAETLEECLCHLEEFCDALESFRQSGIIPSESLNQILEQSRQIEKLGEQIEYMEQFTQTTNKLLDELNVVMKEAESSHGQSGKIKEITKFFKKLFL